MASINISTNSKGQLVAKIQVSCKDIRTGQNKIKATRVYNEDNLTEAKFKNDQINLFAKANNNE